MPEIEILPFDVHSASEDEWKRYHEFRNHRKEDKDALTNSHQISDKKFEETLKITPKLIDVFRFNAFEKGGSTQIGEVYFSYYKKDKKRNLDQSVAMVNVSVLKPYRHHGYGVKLLGKIVELAKEYNKSKLLFQTTEKDGIKIIEDFGASKMSEHQQFKLNIEDTDWDLVNRWLENSKSLLQKVKLEWINVKEGIPESLVDQYSRIQNGISINVKKLMLLQKLLNKIFITL